MRETLTSFWNKLQVGTKLKLTGYPGPQGGEVIMQRKVTIKQTNGFFSSGQGWRGKHLVMPLYFAKPKASECVITENQLVWEEERGPDRILGLILKYEILEG